MISSLTSRFSYFNRRALFVSAHKVAVYHWYKGRVASSYLFDVNEEGRQYFERYLSETANIPVYILVDAFEEEYRRETIPHVFGADRQALLNRKRDRLFRDTPYTYYEIQERETDGRRDDNILLTAITNPGVVRPWIELLVSHKIAIVGVYSVPLLASSLINTRPELKGHTLLVSMQSISGLRQTFIQNGKLRISRLVQLPRYGTSPYAPYIVQEVEKIQRYLNSLRLIPGDEPLDICFLLAGDLLQEFKEELTETELVRHHLLNINDLAQEAGLDISVATPFSDQLFVSYLLKKTPANQYASGAEKKYFSMRRTRYAMLVMSMLLMVAGLLWSGYNFFNGLSYKQQSIAADMRRQFYAARYDMARERLPATPVGPEDLQHVVELSARLKAYKTSPLKMVQVISQGLNKYPMIQVKNIAWATSIDPNVEIGGKSRTSSRNQNKIGFSNVGFTDTGYAYYQIALIEGYIDPFDGDFRQAIASINEYAESLRKENSVHDVSVITLPLDVSSSASLQGNTQGQAKTANFSLRVVVGIRNET